MGFISIRPGGTGKNCQQLERITIDHFDVVLQSRITSDDPNRRSAQHRPVL